jgi:hypothetical protein
MCATGGKMSKTSQVKLIREAYRAIPDLFDGFFNVRDRLLEMNLDAERRHRKGAPYGIKHGISAQDAAKLFVVRHLLDGLAEPDRWTVDDILHIRNEVLYAQAYAKKHASELVDWRAKYGGTFVEVDYAALMDGNR